MKPKEKWIELYPGIGGHNGEYDWKCSTCGYEDWWPSYTNPNKANIKCPKCIGDSKQC